MEAPRLFGCLVDCIGWPKIFFQPSSPLLLTLRQDVSWHPVLPFWPPPSPLRNVGGSAWQSGVQWVVENMGFWVQSCSTPYSFWRHYDIQILKTVYFDRIWQVTYVTTVPYCTLYKHSEDLLVGCYIPVFMAHKPVNVANPIVAAINDLKKKRNTNTNATLSPKFMNQHSPTIGR